MPSNPNKRVPKDVGRRQDVEMPNPDDKDPYRRNRESRDLNSSQQEEENRSARQRAVKKHPDDKSGTP
ncbi:MAG TPA: hypothetical protein VFR18_24120 [Terriglobia bacterium]|nr:hypothetical protein [Terriglobia bacterium]